MTRCILCSALALAAAASAGEPPLAKLETQMFEIVNRDRAKEKLPPLAWRDDLAAIARAHSADMAAHAFFAHESPRTGRVGDRLDKAKIPKRGAGENLAYQPTVEAGQQALMRSPGHRKNILGTQFSQLGIGIVRDGKGWLLITQVFLTPPPVHDVAALHKRIVEGIAKARAAKGLRRLLPDAQLAERALAHSERAAIREDYDTLWLEDRLARDRDRWSVHEAAFFLTDDVGEAIHCDVALNRRYGHFGVGVVQGSVRGMAKGRLWITLVCAPKK